MTAGRRASKFMAASLDPDPSRDEKSEAQYRERYSRPWRQCEAETDTHTASRVACVNWLNGRRSELKASTFRFYRSASIFAMCEHAPGTTEGAIERADRLEALGILQNSRGGTVAEFQQSDVRYSGPKRTSGKRVEKVDVQDGDRSVETLNLSKSRYADQSASSCALVSIQGGGHANGSMPRSNTTSRQAHGC